MKIHDVHTVAERYLKDLETGRDSFYASPREEETLPITASLTEPVVVIREGEPHYLVGFKPSGRPVFTHDFKLAETFDSASLTLVAALSRLKTYGEKAETMPAVWPSNYWRG